MGTKLSKLSESPSKPRVEDDLCLICLSPTLVRGGGIPIMSPGCCGKMFHQSCIDQAIAAGNSACPHCRHAFPNSQSQTQFSSQIAPNQQQQLPFQPRRSSLLNDSSSGSKRLPAEEELLDLVGDVTTTGTSSMEGPVESSASQILVSSAPERSEINLGENSVFYVNVNVKAVVGTSDTTSSRVPMDLVCVLDNSGSMDGSKWRSVQEAMRFVRSQLSPQDRLSVVIFNSSASTLHGLRKMSDTNKDASGSAIDATGAGGGTRIHAGMKMATDILDARQTKNSIAGIFLLTDGQDNSDREAKKELGGNIRRQGYSLFCFGFGNDHDSAQLQEIANAAEAPFTFVEADSMVVDAFGGALGGQQGVIGRNLVLSINTHVPLLQTFSGRYLSRPGAAGAAQSVDVSFANIFDGEQRNVLVKLSIPECSAATDVYPLLQASLRYETLAGDVCHGVALVPEAAAGATATEGKASSAAEGVAHCSIGRVSSPSAAVSVDVDVQKNRAIVTAVLEQSLSSADRHQFAEGRKLIQDTLTTLRESPSFVAGNVICVSLAQDLEGAMKQMRTEAEYFSGGGRACMTEAATLTSQERCMYSSPTKMKSPYQSIVSSNVQAKAQASKVSKF